MATAATASGPPSTSWTTRPSRAIDGSTAASDRPMATACHDHGSAQRGLGEGVDGQQRGRLPAEHPGRAVVADGRVAPGPGGSAGWPRTSRTRGPVATRPSTSAPSRSAGWPMGWPRPGRRWRSPPPARAGPRRGGPGRDRCRLEALDEAAHQPARLLEGEPRVALAEPLAGRAAGRARRRCAGRSGRPPCAGQPAGRQDRVQEGQAQGGQDGRGAQVALDALDDGHEGDELARRCAGR